MTKKEATKSAPAPAPPAPPPSRLPVISNRRGALPRNSTIKRRKIEKPVSASKPVKPVEPLRKRNPRSRRQAPVAKIPDQNNQKKEDIEKAEIKADIESVMIDVSQPVMPMFPLLPDLSPPLIEPIFPVVQEPTVNGPKSTVNGPKAEQKSPVKNEPKEEINERQLNGQFSRRLASKPRKRWNKDEVCSESSVTSGSRPRSQGSSTSVQGLKEKKTPRRQSEPNKLAHLFELATTPKGVKYHEVKGILKLRSLVKIEPPLFSSATFLVC